MAAAEIKITPLVTVIEQLRADNNESALMHDERDVKRDTMLVNINAELTSIKDSILFTRDIILDRNQQDEMKTSNTSLLKISDNIDLSLLDVIEWLQTLAFKIDTSNSLLYSIEFTSGKQVDLMGEDSLVTEIDEGNSQNAKWHDEERARQADSDAILASSSAVTGGWLGKIFGGQNKARKEAAEAAREAARKTGEGAGGGGGGGGLGAGKGGALGRGIGGLFRFFGGLIKGVGKFAVMLLKPLVWLAKIPLMLASVTALWVGLAAVVGFFALVTVASMSMSQKDFDALKLGIANGVAGAIQKVVDGAMTIWNSFVPDSWKISPEAKKKFSEGTFTAVSETIVAVIEFVEGISKAFSKGFQSQIEGFGKAWEGFKTVFDKIVNVFEGTTEGKGAAIEGGLKSAAEFVGAAIVKIGAFFLDLATALGAEALGETAKTDNKFINTAAGIIVGIIKFIKDIVVNFGTGFADTFKDISEKFVSLKDKIGKVATKVGEMFTAVGEGASENKTTIMGVFNTMGKWLGKFIEGILYIANFIADLIIDPTVTLAKAQVGIEDAFQSMGNNIADFFDKIFNKEAFLKMAQGMFGEDSLMMVGVEKIFGTVEDAAADRQKEMEADKERLKRKSGILAEIAKQADASLQAELKKGKERDDAEVSKLTKAVARAKSEEERNVASIERIEENITESKEIIVQEKVSEKMGEAGRKQEKKNAALKSKMAAMEGESYTEQTDPLGMGAGVRKKGLKALEESDIKADIAGVGLMAGTLEFTAKTFEKMVSVLGGKGGLMEGVTAEQLASGEAKLTPEAIKQMTIELGGQAGALKGLSNVEDQMIIFQAGIDRLTEIEERKSEVEAIKLKLAETDAALAEKRAGWTKTIRKQEGLVVEELPKESGGQTGGFVIKGGLAEIHQGELLIDNASAQLVFAAAEMMSGLNLMDLQRDKAAIGSMSATTIVNNTNSQQINQSRPMILPPSPIVPGNVESTLAAA